MIGLCSRPAWAKLLLEKIAAGKVDRGLVPAFQVRQMSSYSDPEIQKQSRSSGRILKSVDTAKKERITKWKTLLAQQTQAPANLSAGRGLFNKSCASCHILFGQGGKIGPDLTGSQRSNIDYLLENIGDPSAQVAVDYRMATIALKDGRVLNGVVTDRPGPTIIVQTPTERLFLNRDDIEEMKKTELSLMPEGLLDAFKEQEIRDLMGYLMYTSGLPPV
ncbi:MAG: c-type cytochrome [Planctomycetales bacterium]